MKKMNALNSIMTLPFDGTNNVSVERSSCFVLNSDSCEPLWSGISAWPGCSSPFLVTIGLGVNGVVLSGSSWLFTVLVNVPLRLNL